MRRCSAIEFIPLPIVLFTALALGCVGAEEGPRVSAVDSAGVKVVTTAGVDRPLDWGRVEVARIGRGEASSEGLLVDPVAVTTDDAGQFFVLERRTAELKMFDPTGRWLRTIAGSGDGPGELRDPTGLGRIDGVLYVIDLGKRALVRFDSAGAPLSDHVLPPGVTTGALVDITDDGQLLVQRDSSNGPIQPQSPLTRVIDAYSMADDGTWGDPVRLAEAGWRQPSFSPVGAPGCPRMTTPPVFDLQPVWATVSSGTALAASAEYQIDIASLDGTRERYRRSLAPRAATAELAAAEIGHQSYSLDGIDCTQSGTERAEQAGWAELIPWIVDVAEAPDGSLWVLRRAPEEESTRRIDVFDTTGEYRGTLPPDFTLPIAWSAPDHIVVIERNALDVPHVVVYRVGPS